jgi:ADP-heptose:LPS heptosyltransferase
MVMKKIFLYITLSYALSILNGSIVFACSKEVYIWFEANNRSYLEKYIDHAKNWEKTGKLIMTARIFNVESFVSQLNELSIPVIAGFKTSNVFNDKNFHDSNAWKEIARIARNVSSLTDGRPVVLENEGTVKAMLSKNITQINYDKLCQSISAQEWPEIWFWYAPAGEKEPVKTMSMEIAHAIMASIPNARLIEASSAGFSTSAKNYNSRKNLQRTSSIDKRAISIIYLDDERHRFWRFKDIERAIDSAAGDTVILYPGFDDIEKSHKLKKNEDGQVHYVQ